MPGEEKDIDLKVFKKLCHFQFTVEEIAAYFEVSKRTIQRRINDPVINPPDGTTSDSPYKEAFEAGRASGRSALRRLQWRHANEKGSHAVHMTIHLSKFWLGETEKSLMTGANDDGKTLPPRTINVKGGLSNPADVKIDEVERLPNPFAPPPPKGEPT